MQTDDPGSPSDAVPTPIAVAALVRSGRILLGHRHPHRRWYPDCWDLLGGHIEEGETAREAVVRECREEIGVDILDPVPFSLVSNDPTLVMHAFVVTRWEGEPVNTEPDEHDALEWFGRDDLAPLTLADPAMLATLRSILDAHDEMG